MVPDAHGLQASQHEERPVEIVDAPAPKPASVRLLFFEDELDRLLHSLVATGVAVVREHLQDAAGDVDRRRIEHRVVVGERDVLEDHLRVVFVEAGPATVLALHGEDPVQRPLATRRSGCVRGGG